MARIINRALQLEKNPNNLDNLKNVLDTDEQNLNILHKFRSYSYHHVLIAANTTTVAKAVMQSSDLQTFMHPTTVDNVSTYTDKYRAVTPPGMSKEDGEYMVLINGMTDAEFMIQGLDIETIIAPSASMSNPHSCFVEGTMDIIEPKGVRFMNLLKLTCDNLRADPSSLVFVLKTIFVGYSDEGSSGTVTGAIQQFIETDPFYFTCLDLTGEFNAAGSSYHMTFSGMTNGSSRMPMFGTVQQSSTSGGTIGSAVATLQKNLNEAADKAYKQLTTQLAETNKENPTPGKNYNPKGRKIQYTFMVADEYKDLPIDNVNPRNMGSGGVAALGTPQSIDVDTALSDIMYSSTKVVELMNKNVLEGYKAVFKIESTVETTTEIANVIYTIKTCYIPVMIKDNTSGKGTMLTPDVSRRNVIEYDYIFTGNNVDVLEYDMKMAAGMAFFQTIGSTSNIPGSYHGASGNATFLGSGPGTVLNDADPIMRDLTIVPLQATLSDPTARTKVEPSKTADMRVFMARQAAIECLNTKMRVAGNPYLLSAFNPRGAGDLSVRPQAETVPLFKVNIRMPTRDDEFVSGDKDYTEQFWYDGYFQVISIRTSFHDGKFDHELELLSMPFEEMVTPTDSLPPASSATSSVNSQSAIQKATPTVKSAPINNSGAATSKPTMTVEQQKKHGIPPPTLTPEEQLNCQSIRKLKPYTVEMCRRTKLSKSFTLYDFIAGTSNQAQHCKWNIEAMDDQILDNLCNLAKRLEAVQELLGHNISINSVYRCPKYNGSTAGSSGTSDHMWGAAADFTCSAFGTPQQIQAKIKASGMDLKQCLTEHRRGSGTNGWVHLAFNLDSRQKPTAESKKFFHMEV